MCEIWFGVRQRGVCCLAYGLMTGSCLPRTRHISSCTSDHYFQHFVKLFNYVWIGFAIVRDLIHAFMNFNASEHLEGGGVSLNLYGQICAASRCLPGMLSRSFIAPYGICVRYLVVSSVIWWGVVVVFVLVCVYVLGGCESRCDSMCTFVFSTLRLEDS